jgi:hypothetical protein
MTIGHRPELDAENAVDDGMWDVDERSIEQSEVAGRARARSCGGASSATAGRWSPSRCSS